MYTILKMKMELANIVLTMKFLYAFTKIYSYVSQIFYKTKISSDAGTPGADFLLITILLYFPVNALTLNQSESIFFLRRPSIKA